MSGLDLKPPNGATLERWKKEREYEMAKRKLWQEIRADWHLKVGDNQAIYDKLAVCWKAGYDRGFHGHLV